MALTRGDFRLSTRKNSARTRIAGTPLVERWFWWIIQAHNRVEQLYHPHNYKRKFCSYFPFKLQNCEYKELCSFAHCEDEILVKTLHNLDYDEDFFMFLYKTEWCPMNLTHHNKSKCVYAHNLQDFRRKVHESNYSPELCENWDFKSFVKSSTQHCKLGNACPKSHGWKESEFHPLNYLTRSCLSSENCPRGIECPFFHSPQDKRLDFRFTQSHPWWDQAGDLPVRP